jgi:glutaredoxin
VIERLLRIIRGVPASPTISVTLWGKPDCSLCDKAVAILERLNVDYCLRIDKRDITADSVGYERYRYVIPVVEIQGGPSFEGKISEHRLRQAFQALIAASTSSSTRHD